MSEPYWFSRWEALALHEMLLAEYGGRAGLRDASLLESALARPRQRFHYHNPTPPELAASYAAGVVKNHPFVDGNKRTGFVLAAGFLERNGLRFSAAEVDAVMQTLALAAGDLDEAGYATWLAANCGERENR